MEQKAFYCGTLVCNMHLDTQKKGVLSQFFFFVCTIYIRILQYIGNVSLVES